MYIHIMILSTKLFNLLGILALGSFSLQVAVANDDLDDILKQALFLVKLLKSDFAQNLRSSNGVMTNSTEDENSTCSLPSDDFNSTTAMNTIEVTRGGVSSTDVVSTTPSTPDTPPTPPNFNTPFGSGAPMMMPYASWPPKPMGYPPPPGPGRQNSPDENYRFPYRFNRRRMMPDYYYYDSPVKSRGNYRRFGYIGNDSTDNLGNTGSTPATSQAETTSSLSSATSEAPTFHVNETTAATTSLPTTIAPPSTSILPITEQHILRTTNSANQSILPMADSTKQSILPIADSAKQTILTTTKEPNLPTIIQSTLTTKTRKRVRHGTRARPVSKATARVISNRKENHLNVSHHHLRHHTTTAEKYTKYEVEMSQVASELEKELEGTNAQDTSDVHASQKDSKHHYFKNQKETTTTTTRTITTMKVFLQGSSRIPIPLPENNGFCHFHPENTLCGTNL